MIKHIFIDMDGVLADFELGCSNLTGKTPDQWRKFSNHSAMWRAFGDLGEFYSSLPPMPYAADLLDHLILEVQPLYPGLTFSVLSALPLTMREESKAGKQAWIQAHFPFLEATFTTDSTKTSHGSASTVLIDDRLKIVMAWHEANLPVIHHTGDAAATLGQLDRLLASRNQSE